MKKIALALVSLLAMFSFAITPLATTYADTTDVFTSACSANSSDTTLCKDTKGSSIFSIIKTIIQIMLIVAGIIAVIMIIIGGIRYMTSNGDQADVKAAKDTILYAIIGLIVCMIAFSVVTWVIGKL